MSHFGKAREQMVSTDQEGGHLHVGDYVVLKILMTVTLSGHGNQ